MSAPNLATQCHKKENERRHKEIILKDWAPWTPSPENDMIDIGNQTENGIGQNLKVWHNWHIPWNRTKSMREHSIEFIDVIDLTAQHFVR